MTKLANFIKGNKFPLFIFLLTLIFFYKQLLHPNQAIYPAFDLHNTYSFLRIFFVESVKKYAEIPLWNPFSFGGEPFLGNSQSAMFYPLNILYFLSPDLIFGYVYLLDFFLLGLFTYLFAREIKLEKFSSFISAITMMFSGIVTTKILSGHIVIMDALIWFPLLMLLYEKSISTNKYLYFILSGIPIALMLLAGNVQIAGYSLFVALLYLLFRITDKGLRNDNLLKSLFRGVLISGISLLIGFSLAAVQLIPSYEFSQLSVRAGGLPYVWASDFSFHPYQWISIFLPHFFGYPLDANTYWGFNGNFWEICAYMGIFPLVLGFLPILLKRTRLIIFFTVLGIFALLSSSGRFSFVFPFFFYHIPGFALFRAPARFLYIYGFSISILAGFGCNTLFSEKVFTKYKNPLKKLSLMLLTVISVSSLVLIAIYLNLINIPNILQLHGYAIGNNLQEIRLLMVKDLFLFIILLIFSVGILILRNKHSVNIGVIKILICGLILSDLWIFGLKFYSTKNLNEIYPALTDLKYIGMNSSLFRIFDIDGKLIEEAGRNKIYSVTGFESLYLKNYQDFLWLAGDHAKTPYEGFFTFYKISNFNILRLLNTKYIVTDKNLTSDVIKKRSNLYELKDTLPHAFIVPNAIVVNNKNKLMDNLKNTLFDYKNNILLEEKPPYPIKNSSLYQPVKITNYSPNKIELFVNLTKPGFLLLSEIWFPGWKAYDNGKELEIFKTNYIFKSVYLSIGKHSVRFVYRPGSYETGKKITFFAILLTGIILLFYRKHKNK